MSDISYHRVKDARVTETTHWTNEEDAIRAKNRDGALGLDRAHGCTLRSYYVQKIEITHEETCADGESRLITEKITLFTDSESCSLLDPTPMHPSYLGNTVAEIEPGYLYEIPAFCDNGVDLESRGRCYVTNVIPQENGTTVVEGVWFLEDYHSTREVRGTDGEYRSPCLIDHRPAYRVR